MDLYWNWLQDNRIMPGSEYAKIQGILAETEEKICEKFKNEPLLDTLLEAQQNLNRVIEEEAFAGGFRIGAKLMLEIISKSSAV